MKLKDNVTKEMLEELGFEKLINIYYYEIERGIEFRIEKDNIINIICEEPMMFIAPNILLKMFRLGYIEEVEK